MVDRPIAHWNLPPYRDVDDTFNVGVVAFDRNSIQSVTFAISGVAIGSSSTQALNSDSGSYEYFATIADGVSDNFYTLQAYVVAVGAKIGLGEGIRLITLPVTIFAGSANYTDFYCNADTGSDAGAGSSGDPFETIGKALESLAGTGDGGRVYLQEATAAYGYTGTVHLTALTTTNRYVNILGAVGSDRANITIDTWDTDIDGATKVHVGGVTITTPVTGPGSGTLWLDDCVLSGGSSAWAPSWGDAYLTGSAVSGFAVSGFKLVRGCTLTGVGWAGSTDQAIVDTTITDAATGISATDATTYDNLLAYNVSALDVTGAAVSWATSSEVQTFTNCALVNFLGEGASSSTFRDITPDHLVLLNCGFNTGHFAWACSVPAKLAVKQCVFQRMSEAAGSVLPAPNMVQVESAFTDCHYIDAGLGQELGTASTTGSAGYTNESDDDYTPASGSALYDDHTATQLVRSDQEGFARGAQTTVGPLRGAEEGSGVGDAPPSALVFTPEATLASVDSLITPIVATWSGDATLFEVAPSIYHTYQAPPEIPCDAADAHFEIRAWDVLTDPLKGDGTSPPFVVEDLRNGTVYLKHPKLNDADVFSPVALAINLCGPFAGEVSGVTANGPWEDGIRPIIRIAGDISNEGVIDGGATGQGTGVIMGRAKQPTDTGGVPAGTLVGWAGVSGAGGFMPFFSGSPSGKGAQVTVSFVGASSSGVADVMQGFSMSQGYLNLDGTWDETFAPIDILFKSLVISGRTFANGNTVNGTNSSFTGEWGERTGRLRIYDCTLRPPSYSLAQSAFGGFGMKSAIRHNVAAHYDLRRNTFAPNSEHAVYGDLINGGLLRDDLENRDSWFIDNVLPDGTERSLFQFVDRCYDYASGPENPPVLGQTTTLPAGTGWVLFERNKVMKPSGDGTSYITMYSGARITWILRGNRVEQLGDDPVIGHKWDDAEYQIGDGTAIRKRAILGESSNAGGSGGSGPAGIRFNENGYPIYRIIIIDQEDATDFPNEKRMSFRHVEEVHVYSFKHEITTGSPRADIGLNDADLTDIGPSYTQEAADQFDVDGVFRYSSQPGSGGQPISANGGFFPPVGAFYLYGGYDKSNPTTWSPTAYGGWLPSGTKMQGAISPATEWGDLSDATINGLRGTPTFLPAGLDMSATTGGVTGTPTEATGIDFGSLTPLGTAITSPGAYIKFGDNVGYTWLTARASNAHSDDSWTPGEFFLRLLDTATAIPVNAPVATVTVTSPVAFDVAYGVEVSPPTASVSIEAPIEYLQVDQEGPTMSVRPPHAEVSVEAPALFTVQADTEVAAPTAIINLTAPTDGITVFGASIPVSDGPPALEGLRAGVDDIMGLSA